MGQNAEYGMHIRTVYPMAVRKQRRKGGAGKGDVRRFNFKTFQKLHLPVRTNSRQKWAFDNPLK